MGPKSLSVGDKSKVIRVCIISSEVVPVGNYVMFSALDEIGNIAGAVTEVAGHEDWRMQENTPFDQYSKHYFSI